MAELAIGHPASPTTPEKGKYSNRSTRSGRRTSCENREWFRRAVAACVFRSAESKARNPR